MSSEITRSEAFSNRPLYCKSQKLSRQTNMLILSPYATNVQLAITRIFNIFPQITFVRHICFCVCLCKCRDCELRKGLQLTSVSKINLHLFADKVPNFPLLTVLHDMTVVMTWKFKLTTTIYLGEEYSCHNSDKSFVNMTVGWLWLHGSKSSTVRSCDRWQW